MNKVLLTLLVCMTSLFICEAQTLKQLVKAGDAAFARKDYYNALALYKEVSEIEPERTDIWYNYGESARKFYAYGQAEKAYRMVLENEDRANFPLAGFWLAVTKKNLGKYQEAANQMQGFIDSYPTKEDYYHKRAKAEIASMSWMQQMLTEVDSMPIVHLDKKINTPYNDFAPYMLDETLYYSSLRFENAKDDNDPQRPVSKTLAAKEKEEGKVLDFIQKIDSVHTCNATFNATGSRMYYTRCNYINSIETQCKIFYRNKEEKGWSAPIMLPEHINAPGSTNTHPNIGYSEQSGRELLFFASNRAGGKGKLDIWCSIILKDGEISKPVTIDEVNTPENDITPFFHSPSQTLYFSSDGHQNFGGYDIFKSERDGDNWLEAVNLNSPINTSFNDLYFFVNDAATEAYLASNRDGAFYLDEDGEACCNDIWKVTLPIEVDLFAYTFNSLNDEALSKTKVELIDLTDAKSEAKSNLESNDFYFPLELEKEYMVIGSKIETDEVWTSDTVTFNTLGITESTTFEESLLLTPMIDLLALTFDAVTLDPLNGTEVQLIDLTADLRDSKYNPDGNDFFWSPLGFEKKYMIVAYKEDYYPDTVYFNTLGVTMPKHYEEKLYLRPKLSQFPILPLYFDNDHPDIRTTRTYTKKNYEETYLKYYPKKTEFVNGFSEGLTSVEEVLAKDAVDRFFEDSLRVGYERLMSFSDQLLKYLSKSSANTTELVIKGYASPRALNDYNKALSRRRVSCLKNHFKTYAYGAFMKFLDSGQLKLSEEFFGEENAVPGISDDYNDIKNSIYSVEASRERRVEIIEIKTTENGHSSVINK